ncbi:13275_t:CDS:2, partial [Ambispora leptoticha]
MDQNPTWEFTCKYLGDYPGASPEQIKKAYQEYLKTQGEELISKPTHELPEKIKGLFLCFGFLKTNRILSIVSLVWDNAFKIEFQEPVNFLTGLTDRLKEVASDSASYNYLVVVQSSGYGKTRSICELGSKGISLIYVCFRSKSSTGYPPATPMSDVILNELMTAENIDTAHAIAGQWIRAMIKTYYDNDLFSKPADLLNNK